MVVAFGVLAFLMTYVVPKFAKIFDDFGQKLPTLTTILIGISQAFLDRWYFILGGVFGLYLLFRVIKSTEQGKMALDTAKLNLPVFGILARKSAVARFSRTLGTLITSGVPILQALNIVRETSGNEVISKAVGNVHDSIREGESIAGPLRARYHSRTST